MRLEGGHRRYTSADVAAVVDVCRRRETPGSGSTSPSGRCVPMRTLRRGPRSSPTSAPCIRPTGHNACTSAPCCASRAPSRTRWRPPPSMATSSPASRPVGTSRPHATAGGTSLAPPPAPTSSLTSPTSARRATRTGTTGPALVAVPPSAPMAREWIVICDAPDLSVALLGSDLPGQQGTPEPDRPFDAIWTVDRRVVRDASRRCAEVAAASGKPSRDGAADWRSGRGAASGTGQPPHRGAVAPPHPALPRRHRGARAEGPESVLISASRRTTTSALDGIARPRRPPCLGRRRRGHDSERAPDDGRA